MIKMIMQYSKYRGRGSNFPYFPFLVEISLEEKFSLWSLQRMQQQPSTVEPGAAVDYVLAQGHRALCYFSVS